MLVTWARKHLRLPSFFLAIHLGREMPSALVEKPPFATMFSTSVQLQTKLKTTHIIVT
jgi:hypothetical protein